MPKFNFMFTVVCPACQAMFEVSHFSVEAIHDGLSLGKCDKCGTEVFVRLSSSPPLPEGAYITWVNDFCFDCKEAIKQGEHPGHRVLSGLKDE